MNHEFSERERDSMSRGFDAGNYGNAYQSQDWEAFAEYQRLDQRSDVWRVAALLGFYSSYALHEIPSDMRDEFDQAYWSPAGQYVVKVACYCDDRDDEYKTEHDSF